MRTATPLFVVILLIGIVDVILAVDSIPAIFAITMDPFLAITLVVLAVAMVLSLKVPPRGRPQAAYPFAAKPEEQSSSRA